MIDWPIAWVGLCGAQDAGPSSNSSVRLHKPLSKALGRGVEKCTSTNTAIKGFSVSNLQYTVSTLGQDINPVPEELPSCRFSLQP